MLHNRQFVNSNKSTFASSSPIQSPININYKSIEQQQQQHDLLINNFNDLINQHDYTMTEQHIVIEQPPQQQFENLKHIENKLISNSNSIQNLFLFSNTTATVNNTQQTTTTEHVYNADMEDEILRKLLIKLKKFSNDLNKEEKYTDKRLYKKNKLKRRLKLLKRNRNCLKKGKINKKRIQRKLLTGKKDKILSAAPQITFQISSRNHLIYNNEPITSEEGNMSNIFNNVIHTNSNKYKSSNKIEKLLNDSRGMCKYFVDYNISTLSSTSILNNSSTNSSPKQQLLPQQNRRESLFNKFNYSFDNEQIKLQIEELEQHVQDNCQLDVHDLTFNIKDNILFADHYIDNQFNYSFEENTLIKSTCSSGYMSDN